MILLSSMMDIHRTALLQGVHTLQRKVQDKLAVASGNSSPLDQSVVHRSCESDVITRHNSSIEDAMDHCSGFKPASFWVRFII